MRPVLADVGETAQFLAIKGLVLNNEARDRFLDWLYEDLAAALRKLMRVARGDYSDTGTLERFPKFEGRGRGRDAAATLRGVGDRTQASTRQHRELALCVR